MPVVELIFLNGQVLPRSDRPVATSPTQDAVDIGTTSRPHPDLGESIGKAAEKAQGRCTNLPRGK